MIRNELLRTLLPLLRNHLVVCNIGAPSQELHALDDQDSNFYMLGTMGLCSSIGFGLALVQEKTVVAIDGDGSVLTNLGTLSTIGNHRADNFILLVVDNGSYGSTGDQPTYTGGRTRLAAVARACGCDNVIEAPAAETPAALSLAIKEHRQTVIIAKCDSGNVDVPVIPLDPITIIERFKSTIRSTVD
ncbi:MAG: sulfopyruvate decarboxylase subunit beta [Rhodobacteraceae bacterium]|nr:sulfopyruvate decarboxylase subunit beta [Paracoccaceae bacterium]